jgi:hypothetical protein
LSKSYWIIKCEFPDDDKITYVLEETLMGISTKKFQTKDDAELYARENLTNLFYNIEEQIM